MAHSPSAHTQPGTAESGSTLVGTQWRENDKRFVRIVEVVAASPQKIGRRTVSMDGHAGHPTRVTYGDRAKFFKNFTQQAAVSPAEQVGTTPQAECAQ